MSVEERECQMSVEERLLHSFSLLPRFRHATACRCLNIGSLVHAEFQAQPRQSPLRVGIPHVVEHVHHQLARVVVLLTCRGIECCLHLLSLGNRLFCDLVGRSAIEELLIYSELMGTNLLDKAAPDKKCICWSAQASAAVEVQRLDLGLWTEHNVDRPQSAAAWVFIDLATH